MTINEILEKSNKTIEEIFFCAEEVKNNGDIIIIKLDGERESNWYTIIIFSPSSKFETIRSDSSDFLTSMISVLNRYIKVK